MPLKVEKFGAVREKRLLNWHFTVPNRVFRGICCPYAELLWKADLTKKYGQ